MELVTRIDNVPMATSKEVADNFGKKHRNVMADIKALDCSEGFRALNFQLSSYISPQNKTLPCYNMTKNGFTYLAFGYKGGKFAKFKEAYIAAYDRMDSALVGAAKSIAERMNANSIDYHNNKVAGQEWSALGRKIKQAQDDNEKEFAEVNRESQLRLTF